MKEQAPDRTADIAPSGQEPSGGEADHQCGQSHRCWGDFQPKQIPAEKEGYMAVEMGGDPAVAGFAGGVEQE